MATDPGTDLAVLIATELVKQVPVQDALQPPAKETGRLLEDAIKCVRLVAFPLQVGAVLQDRFRDFLAGTAQKVKLENRIAPQPQILGPVLEAIRFVPEGSISEQLFSELLARAFDRERAGQAHPAFPNIVRALGDDEVEILRRLSLHEGVLIRIGFSEPYTGAPVTIRSDIGVDFPYLINADLVMAYLTHLEALGLIQDLDARRGDTEISGEMEGLAPAYWNLILSHFGELFVSAVFKVNTDKSDSG